MLFSYFCHNFFELFTGGKNKGTVKNNFEINLNINLKVEKSTFYSIFSYIWRNITQMDQVP